MNIVKISNIFAKIAIETGAGASYHCGYSKDINRNVANIFNNFNNQSIKYPAVLNVLPLQGELDIRSNSDQINYEIHIYAPVGKEKENTLLLQTADLKARMELFLSALDTNRETQILGAVKYFTDSVVATDNCNVIVFNFNLQYKNKISGGCILPDAIDTDTFFDNVSSLSDFEVKGLEWID